MKVIYHVNCPDGTCSAWVFQHYMKKIKSKEKVEYLGCLAGKYLDMDYKDQDVYFLDISYKKDELLEIAKVAKSITIYDHHESARKDLEDLKCDNVKTVFDMNRCGAQIVWDELFPGVKRPWFVDIIGDRDLWLFKLPGSKEIGKYFMHYQMYNNESFDKMLTYSASYIKKMETEGKIFLDIETKQNYRISKGATLTKYKAPDGKEYKVYLVGCLHENVSEVGNILAQKKECDFAACFRYNFPTDEWWLSLRAHHDGIDLTTIGKGHKKSSGLTLKGNLHTYFTPIV